MTVRNIVVNLNVSNSYNILSQEKGIWFLFCHKMYCLFKCVHAYSSLKINIETQKDP